MSSQFIKRIGWAGLTLSLALIITAAWWLTSVDWTLLRTPSSPYDELKNSNSIEVTDCPARQSGVYTSIRNSSVYSSLPPREAWAHYLLFSRGSTRPIINASASINCGNVSRLPFADQARFDELGVEVWRYTNDPRSASIALIEAVLRENEQQFARGLGRLQIDRIRLIVATLCHENELNSFEFAGRADLDILTMRLVIVTPCNMLDADVVQQSRDVILGWLSTALHEGAHVQHGRIAPNRDNQLGRVATEILAYAVDAEFLGRPLQFEAPTRGALCAYDAETMIAPIYGSRVTVFANEFMPDIATVGPELPAAMIEGLIGLGFTDDLTVQAEELDALLDRYELDVTRLQRDLDALCA